MFSFLFKCLGQKNKVGSKKLEQEKAPIQLKVVPNQSIVDIDIQNSVQKKKNILLKDTDSHSSKQVSLGSQSTFTTNTMYDTTTKNMKIVEYVYEKITNEQKNR